MQTNQKRTGFSLVELMIALVLGLLLLGSVLVMYSSGKTTATDAESLSRIQENVRFASDYLVRDLRNSGFDDVGELTVAGAAQINKRYLAINIDDGQYSVAIRYAGRGHCAESFDEFRVVQNTYFVEEGELRCTGMTLDESTGLFGDERTSSLVSGVDSMSFETICKDQDPCGIECSASDADPCVGVRVRLNFVGLRPTHSDDSGVRSIELIAGLRNSVLDILYQNVIDEN